MTSQFSISSANVVEFWAGSTPTCRRMMSRCCIMSGQSVTTGQSQPEVQSDPVPAVCPQELLPPGFYPIPCPAQLTTELKAASAKSLHHNEHPVYSLETRAPLHTSRTHGYAAPQSATSWSSSGLKRKLERGLVALFRNCHSANTRGKNSPSASAECWEGMIEHGADSSEACDSSEA